MCVPAGRKKTLAGVLGLGGAPLRPPSQPSSAMPLAVIVDDRLDVRAAALRLLAKCKGQSQGAICSSLKLNDVYQGRPR